MDCVSDYFRRKCKYNSINMCILCMYEWASVTQNFFIIFRYDYVYVQTCLFNNICPYIHSSPVSLFLSIVGAPSTDASNYTNSSSLKLTSYSFSQLSYFVFLQKKYAEVKKAYSSIFVSPRGERGQEKSRKADWSRDTTHDSASENKALSNWHDMFAVFVCTY